MCRRCARTTAFITVNTGQPALYLNGVSIRPSFEERTVDFVCRQLDLTTKPQEKHKRITSEGQMCSFLFRCVGLEEAKRLKLIKVATFSLQTPGSPFSFSGSSCCVLGAHARARAYLAALTGADSVVVS